MKKSLSFMYLFIVLLTISHARAQIQGGDQIITRKGKIIWGNVKKIGNDEITYKKYFRKYNINASKVLYIVDESGKKIQVNDISTAKNYKLYKPAANTNSAFQPSIIERIGGMWRIDTSRLITTKQLNSILAQSPNPMVQMNLKSAKLMRTISIISRITSYPSTLGGGFASFNTFKTIADQMKTGPVSFKSYLNAGLSFLGTISLPITNAILKKIQKKKYDKTIILYSQGS